MKKYRVSHSELTSAPPEEVWGLWSDVPSWSVWDEGMASCALKGSFAPGETIVMTPKGAPQPIEGKLIEVVPNDRFVDETHLPFGTIRATHTIKREGEKSRVTHTFEAEVAPEHAEMFEKAIWSNMEKGVPQSVRNIAKLAEERKKKRK
jgi:hypothetical protein